MGKAWGEPTTPDLQPTSDASRRFGQHRHHLSLLKSTCALRCLTRKPLHGKAIHPVGMYASSSQVRLIRHCDVNACTLRCASATGGGLGVELIEMTQERVAVRVHGD